MSLKLIICLASLTLMSVVTVWMVQIFMSDTLYEKVKNKEVELTANNIRQLVKSDEKNINEHIDEYSEEYDICIGFYKVGDDGIKEIHSSVVFIDNIIYNAPEKMLSAFYDLAKNSGGVYRGRFGFDFFN